MAGDDRDPSRGGDYRQARIGAATAITGTMVVLLVWSAIAPLFGVAYTLDLGTLAILATTDLTLLGLEARSLIRGSGK